jgi:hypothetical protein
VNIDQSMYSVCFGFGGSCCVMGISWSGGLGLRSAEGDIHCVFSGFVDIRCWILDGRHVVTLDAERSEQRQEWEICGDLGFVEAERLGIPSSRGFSWTRRGGLGLVSGRLGFYLLGGCC